MRKLVLCIVCLAAMMAGTGLKAQEISITLVPGWNWISYTNAVSMEIDEALGDFTPVQGDIIKSKNNGTTTYNGTMWRGSLTHFMPGQGYKYFSARTETTSFVFEQAFSSTVTTTEPTRITPYSATSGGSITTNAYVFAKGICWATHSNPTPMDDDHSENGGGNESFTEEITELIPNTTYYVRAYVVAQNGIVYGDEVSFTTIPIWTIEATSNPIDGGTITGTGDYEQNAICNLTAIANEGYIFANWTENGEVVSTDANYIFTVNTNRTLVANFTVQSFTINVSANPSDGGSVSGGDSYYYGQSCTISATAIMGYTFSNWIENDSVVSTEANYTFIVNADRTLVANFTLQSFTINVSASPSDGGNVSGGDTYNYGQSCTVSASANTGYIFSNWIENDSIVSMETSYTFTVNVDRTLVANFTLKSFTINVLASPSNGGSVTGGGSYIYGQSCTVHATANTGYNFTNWTINGNVVSTNANYTFTVNANRTLVANFEQSYPIGAINGLFSVSESHQVYFSQGNLQYIGSASTPYWKFAENQCDYLGDNGQGSPSASVDRDLFGWGTSGWSYGHENNSFNYPWITGTSEYASWYGPGVYNDLEGSFANADWGVYNPISNGGNQPNQWRTLSGYEWNYVFKTRTTPSGIRYAKAKVNGVNGVILLPDDWNISYYSLNNTNQNVNYTSNIITATQWNTLEQHGAVFLPAAGNRHGIYLSYLGSRGYYWSTTHNGSDQAIALIISEIDIESKLRSFGFSVRLVCDAE